MRASIRGTEIFFDIAGMQFVPNKANYIEKPVLFLLHGGPGGNHFHFKRELIELAKFAQLVFIDNRGSGLSKKSKKSDYTLKNNIEDIEALRKYLGLQHISILGVSYGGIVAQGYAIQYGKNLDKLILAATAPSYRFIENAKKKLLRIGTAKQIAVCNKYLWKGTFRSKKNIDYYFKIMDSLYSFRKKRDFKKPSGKLKRMISYEVLNAGFSSFLHHFDYIPTLKKITCPTLILAGEQDWICPPEQSKIIAKHIIQSKLKVFKNCGHSIALDAHKQYLKAVKHFLIKK